MPPCGREVGGSSHASLGKSFWRRWRERPAEQCSMLSIWAYFLSLSLSLSLPQSHPPTKPPKGDEILGICRRRRYSTTKSVPSSTTIMRILSLPYTHWRMVKVSLSFSISWNSPRSGDSSVSPKFRRQYLPNKRQYLSKKETASPHQLKASPQ